MEILESISYGVFIGLMVFISVLFFISFIKEFKKQQVKRVQKEKHDKEILDNFSNISQSLNNIAFDLEEMNKRGK